MIYDIIIVGSGISALYLSYKLKYKNLNILILEKNDYIGGRIKTFHKSINNHEYKWEEGAGRFNDNHKLFIQLLNELDLKKYITKISSQVIFKPSDESYESESKSKSSFINESPNKYLEKIIKYSKTFSKKELQTQTFQDFAKNILTKNEFQFLLDSTGNYYTIFINMNCYDALKIFHFVVNEKIQYYGLKCGYDTIIHNLLNEINNINNIKLNHNVTNIEYINYSASLHNYNISNNIFNVYCNKEKYQSRMVVLTIPKPELLKFKILNPIKPLLNSINNKSLCRIYSVFKEKDIWFKDVDYGKITTNNSSRTYIPIDKENGLIMISYSDGKYADAWNKINDKPIITNKLCTNVNNTFDIKINKPIYTKKSYWKVATSYWLKNMDSNKISKKIIKPYNDIPLYICGEGYSTIQGWIEGALSTVENLLKKL